jgi:hypothetical protein
MRLGGFGIYLGFVRYDSEQKSDRLADGERVHDPDDQKEVLEQCLAVLQNACDVANNQYDDYYKSFAGLDAKAQATATLSGLVLAAIAAFLKDGRIPVLAKDGLLGWIAVLLPPILALFAVLVSLLASRIKDIATPFDSAQRIKDAIEISMQEPASMAREQIFIYYRKQLEYWQETFSGNEDGEGIVQAVERKGRLVKRGQELMFSSLFFLLLLFIGVLVESRALPPNVDVKQTETNINSHVKTEAPAPTK